MPDRRQRAATFLAGLVLCGCGASSAPVASHRLVLDDLGRLSGCTGYGHSGIVGFGVDPSQAFVTKVCRRYVGTVLNLGIGGSTLQGQLLTILQGAPRAAATQLSIVMWGANDLALYGPSLAGYKAGLRLLISRLRTPAVDVHGFRDPALRYTGSWADALGEKVTTGRSGFTWTSPRGFPGGAVAFTAMFRQGLGARYGFTLDGRPAGAWDTRSLGAPPPAPATNTPGAYRIRVPAGAGHVVRCQITALAGGANLTGWQLESSKPPIVVLVEHPRPPNYNIYDQAAWTFHPTDRQILALDRAMGAVAAEFDRYVITVDTDSSIGKQARYFLPDGAHLSVAGNAVVAALIEKVIERDPHVLRAPSAGT